jgi:6-phosphogluconolactonase
MQKIVEVLPNLEALAHRSLEITLLKLHAAIAQRGQFTMALSGGSTPKALYTLLAQQDLPWENIHLFWGDERYVPADHPDSNQGMTRQVWLDQVSFPVANIHPMSTAATDPAISAQQYEAEIYKFFGVQAGEIPHFDLILLGMGDDGHTASLFPHTAALQVRDRLVTVGNKDGQPRLTFTVSLINQATCVLFMVAGGGKQDALRHVFAAEASSATYPARLIQPLGECWWLLDQALGQYLDHKILQDSH